MYIVLSVFALFATTNSRNACTDSHQCINTEIVESEVACSGYYSCAESRLNHNSTAELIHCTGTYSCNLANDLSANDNIHCAGYKSCYSSNDLSAPTIQCSGMSSCDQHSNPDALMSASSLIYCGGQKSCFSSQLSPWTNTYCEGLNACSSATINGDTVFCDANAACSNSHIYTKTSAICSGKSSCAGATIQALQTQFYGEDSGSGAVIKSALIEAYGFRSLVDAVIDSEGQSSVTIKMFAEMAGDGAIIQCRSGSQCSLFCKNTGCKGLKYLCSTGSVCTINPAGCSVDNSVTLFKGIDCPTQYYGDKVKVSTDPKLMSSISDTEDDTISDSLDLIECNLKRECEGNVMDNSYVVKCAGSNSCDSASITTSGVSEMESVNCYGDSACDSAKMKCKTGMISCLGSTACVSTNMNAKHVKCNGFRSCYDTSDIIVVNGKMECGATESCRLSDIRNYAALISTDCTGNRACYKSHITSKGSVVCAGHLSCTLGEISADKHVVCSGKGSCYSSLINAVKRVYAIGYYSAAMSEISTEWVRGYGYHSLLFATIDSKDYTEILVHSFGHQAGYGATVICRENTKCTLTCKGSGCKSMDYMCMNDAICILSPIKCRKEGVDVFAGIDCPNMIMSVVPDGLDQFMKRKQYEMENDQVYNKYKREVGTDNEQFEALGVVDVEEDVDESEFYYGKKFEGFDKQRMVGSSLTIEVIAGVVIGIFIILLGVCFCYNRMKHGNFVYEPIP